MNNIKMFKDVVGWGIGLWLIGYVLGIIAFMLVPVNLIGWFVMPIGVLITVWVLVNKVDGENFVYYLKVAIFWTFTAFILDYIFIVLLIKPADGYYKLDVYIYYVLTFLIPILVGICENCPKINKKLK